MFINNLSVQLEKLVAKWRRAWLLHRKEIRSRLSFICLHTIIYGSKWLSTSVKACSTNWTRLTSGSHLLTIIFTRDEFLLGTNRFSFLSTLVSKQASVIAF